MTDNEIDRLCRIVVWHSYLNPNVLEHHFVKYVKIFLTKNSKIINEMGDKY